MSHHLSTRNYWLDLFSFTTWQEFLDAGANVSGFDEAFPCRVRVKPVIQLTPETGIPIIQLKDQLSIFENLESPFAWTGHVRGSPTKWKATDGEVIVQALLEAKNNSIIRPITKQKLDTQISSKLAAQCS